MTTQTATLTAEKQTTTISDEEVDALRSQLVNHGMAEAETDKFFTGLIGRAGEFTQAQVARLTTGLAKSGKTVLSYAIIAQIILTDGVKPRTLRGKAESWKSLRTAVNAVMNADGDLTDQIVPTIEALVASKRETKPEANVSYKQVCDRLAELARSTSVRASISEASAMLGYQKASVNHTVKISDFVAAGNPLSDEMRASMVRQRNLINLLLGDSK